MPIGIPPTAVNGIATTGAQRPELGVLNTASPVGRAVGDRLAAAFETGARAVFAAGEAWRRGTSVP
jgi:hypothetical protein